MEKNYNKVTGSHSDISGLNDLFEGHYPGNNMKEKKRNLGKNKENMLYKA
jgi:hypothetical protein